MDEIVKMEHVYQYNEMMGQETLHPLVSVIDFSKCPKARHARRMYGFYCVFLKDVKCGDMRYGRHYYDYQEGTLVFIAPGQVVGIEDNGEVFQPKGWALLFHPDLVDLGKTDDPLYEGLPAELPNYDVLPIVPGYTPPSGCLSSPVESSREKGAILRNVAVKHMVEAVKHEFSGEGDYHEV